MDKKSKTAQQNISPIHPTIAIPHNKNRMSPQQSYLQSSTKPNSFGQYSNKDYQTESSIIKNVFFSVETSKKKSFIFFLKIIKTFSQKII